MLNAADDLIKIPENPKSPAKKRSDSIEDGQKNENLFSPRFRSVAAMAGWDEEALMMASFIVEDTPDHKLKCKKRSDLRSLKSPPTNSRRKRKAQRRSSASIPVSVLDLDEDEPKAKQENEKSNNEASGTAEIGKNAEDQVDTKSFCASSSSTPAIPCIDRLREELSCAICLEICYEPSTTPCGHSFCKKCLSSAAEKCGKKCPKCRQLISNARYCTVNTVLWNTIQLLFPKEVEARKATAAALSSDSHHVPQAGNPVPVRTRSDAMRNRAAAIRVMTNSRLDYYSDNSIPEQRHHRIRSSSSSRMLSGRHVVSMATELPSQDGDAALALRLQREEFMEAFTVPNETRNSFAVARAHLRAMASRAVNFRFRGGNPLNQN